MHGLPTVMVECNSRFGSQVHDHKGFESVGRSWGRRLSHFARGNVDA